MKRVPLGAWFIAVMLFSPVGAPAGTAPTPGPTPAAQALNLSTRLRVQTGDNAGIAGFVITGIAPKQLLFRGIGPSLTAFGVAGALANPTLDLRRPDGTRIRANDNWQDDPVQAAAIQATGLAPQNNLEAAIIETLAPGSYTVILRGMGMTTGIGLVEVYDVTQGVDSRLANLSTRAFVSTGDSIVIAGFALGGNPPQAGEGRILLRGIGPSLVNFGIANPLADPKLELRDNNGALLIVNDNWQDTPVEPMVPPGLQPTNPLESAIVATLPPGLYTALLAGVNSGTGIGLVEVYDIAPSGTPPPTPTPTPTPSPGITPSPTPPPATPTPSPAGACTENFDGSSMVFLPGGAWVISTINPFSPPNCLFAPAPDGISDESCDSVNISIHSTAAVLSFRNNFDTEYDPPPPGLGDGYVLEVSLNGGPFSDVTDPSIGGTFVSGGYTGEIGGAGGNPLAGRMAWVGDSGGYIVTTINLPASLNGQTIKLRFRMGTDIAIAAPGVRIDDFALTGGSCP